MRVMQALSRRFDRINITNQIGYRHVRCGQLFAITLFSADPFNGGMVSILGHQITGVFADRRIGMAVYLTTFDNRDMLIKQRG